MSKKTPQTRVLLARTLAPLLLGIADFVWALFYSLVLTPTTTYAAQNSTINFQARLLNAAGAVVPDGSYNVEFKIYNTATSSGSSTNSCSGDGNALWVEDYTVSGGNARTVSDGYLTANLGTYNSLSSPGHSCPGITNWTQQYWLGINIGGTGSSPVWDTEMTPRLQITAVPYALSAQSLSYYNSSTGDTSTLQFTAPTSNDSITLPDATGVVCLSTSTACGLGFTTGSGAGVQLQGSTPGTPQTGNININGTALANTFDASTSGALAIGTNNATAIDLNQNTVVGSGKSFTADGAAVFEDSSVSSTAFQVQNPSAFTVLDVDTNNKRVGINTSSPSTALSVVNGSSSSQGAFLINQQNTGQNILQAQSNGTTVLTVSGTGAVTFENASNSTTAFQVQTSSGSTVLNVDTTNQRLGTSIPPPSTPTLGTISGASGSLSNITYYYEITAIGGAGGQTTVSGEASGTPTSGAIDLTWTAVPGAVSYDVYRGTASGGENVYYNSVANTYLDTGASSTSGSPPTADNGLSDGLSVSGISYIDSGSLDINNTGGTATGQVYVSGSIPPQSPTYSTSSQDYGQYVQGNYLYVLNSAPALQIYNIANPTVAPVALGSIATTSSNSRYIYVQGHFAYVVDQTSNNLQIFDVSNPIAPTLTSTTSTGSSTNPKAIYVQGNYAYVANYGTSTLEVFNVSNPGSPVAMTSGTGIATASGLNPASLEVVGNYAYVVNQGSTGTLQVFDISNPAYPTQVTSGTGVSVGNNASANPYNGLAIQGNYAYVANYGSNTLQILNISNPASPTSVSTTNLLGWGSGNVLGVVVEGRYAYVNTKSSPYLITIDVSTPASPVVLGTTTLLGTNSQDMVIEGRTMWLTDGTGDGIEVFNLGGTYTQTLQAGSAEVSTLQVDSNATVNGDVAIAGGLNVGTDILAAGNIGAGGLTLSGLTKPVLSVVPTCSSSCTATYVYQAVAFNGSGNSISSLPTGSGPTAGTVLSGSVYNTISISPVSGAVGYDIYRQQITGGSPTSTGYIGTAYASTTGGSATFNDTGIAAVGSVPSTTTAGTAGSLVAGGTALFENSANSISAFQVQNASGSSMFNIDTTTGIITLGNSGNTLTFNPDSGITAAGNAEHVKQITLTAEYPGAVLDIGTSGANVGTMTAGYDSTQRENYYNWTTVQTSANTYDVVVTFGLPSDWTSWVSSNSLTVQTWADSVANATGTITVTPTSTGTADSAANGASITPGGANTWTPKSFSLTTTSGLYTANGTMVIRLHMSSLNGYNFRVGNIVLTYDSAF